MPRLAQLDAPDVLQHIMNHSQRLGEARRAHPKRLARLSNIYNSEMYQPLTCDTCCTYWTRLGSDHGNGGRG